MWMEGTETSQGQKKKKKKIGCLGTWKGSDEN